MTEAVRLDDHERFKKLSALSNAEALSSAELEELRAHLQSCRECREVHQQYKALSTSGLPSLAAVRSEANLGEWDDAETRKKLMARLQREDARARERSRLTTWLSRLLLPHALSPSAGAAVAACILLAVAAVTYHAARRARFSSIHGYGEDHSSSLQTDKDRLQAQLATQNSRIAEFEQEGSQKREEIARLNLALRTLADHATDVAAAKSKADAQLAALSEQRDRLTQQLQQAEQASQKIQAELTSLRDERDKALVRAASLESKIDELTAANHDQERKLRDDEGYLASDRDIRELMGARQLYIADVFDVDSHSRTQKPFGRVFYTQGKSLIFYAFDLDTGVKNANFQVWGRKETAQNEEARAMNLGILYMDSESNRRWVMRFDDPKQLAEIDAVFVTVEPRGGSPNPTSKPFLYALLRQEANHP